MDLNTAYLLCAVGIGFVLGCFVGNIRSGSSAKVTFSTETGHYKWEVQGSSVANLMRELSSIGKK